MIFNSCVTMFSISFVSYYKVHSYISDRYKKKQLANVSTINSNKEINIITVNCDNAINN
jgi:hypothetical protein